MNNSLFSVVKKIFKIGLVHIFGAYSLNKIISFVTNIIIVRFLTKYEYGLFGSAYNVYSIFIIFTGLGMISATLLYCSEQRESAEKQAIYRYTLICGFVVDVILCIAMLMFGLFGPVGIEETRRYIIQLSLLPLADYAMQYILVYFRTKRNNQTFAFLSSVNTVAYLLFGGLGAYLFGIGGTIAGRYIAYIITTVIGLFKANSNSDYFNNIRIGDNLKKEIWFYAIKNGSSSALNSVVYLLDVAMITYLISNAEVVASYKLASIIPESLIFIPQAVVVTILPYYAHNKDDKVWLQETTKRLFGLMLCFNMVMCIALLLGAPLIITVLWGSNYLDSVPYFRVLSLSLFFLSSFRLFSTNILAVFRKTTFNLVVSIVTAISDILLDYFLVLKYGAIGAAWATVIVVFIASCISFPYLIKTIWKDNILR